MSEVPNNQPIPAAEAEANPEQQSERAVLDAAKRFLDSRDAEPSYSKFASRARMGAIDRGGNIETHSADIREARAHLSIEDAKKLPLLSSGMREDSDRYIRAECRRMHTYDPTLKRVVIDVSSLIGSDQQDPSAVEGLTVSVEGWYAGKDDPAGNIGVKLATFYLMPGKDPRCAYPEYSAWGPNNPQFKNVAMDADSVAQLASELDQLRDTKDLVYRT